MSVEAQVQVSSCSQGDRASDDYSPSISGGEASGLGFAMHHGVRDKMNATSCHHFSLAPLLTGTLPCTSTPVVRRLETPFSQVPPGLGRPVTATLITESAVQK